MNTLKLGRSYRRLTFGMLEVYAIVIVVAIILAQVLGFTRWLIPLAFVLFLPILYTCLRCILQWRFGPKYTGALVRSMAQRYCVDQRGSYRATVIKAFQKEPERFSAEREDVQARLDALGLRISKGDFDWPDISWWKAYQELADLMDEVITK